MIHLRFELSAAQRAVLGPAVAFRVAGNFIRHAESGEILARYLNHFWEVQGMHFTHYSCPNPVHVHFEDAEGGKTDLYGPYNDLSVADGSVYTQNRLIAKFMDTTILWHDHETDTFWPSMILSAPAS